jgi:hypothetical protein
MYKDGNHVMLNLIEKFKAVFIHSFIQIVKAEYKTWIIYLVMEHSIWFSVQKVKKWAC